MFSAKSQTVMLPEGASVVLGEHIGEDGTSENSNTVFLQLAVPYGEPDEAGVRKHKNILITFQRDGDVISIHDADDQPPPVEPPVEGGAEGEHPEHPIEPPPEEDTAPDESDVGTETTSKKKRKW